MKAMVAYFDWMKRETRTEDKVEGRGVGKVDQTIVPNTENGKRLYAAQCALCHGENGEGIRNAKGEMVYPPLWGDESFNIGAGMARIYTAAAFVKRNMPIAFGTHFLLGQGGLSDQEAVDVAAYFSHMPRPDFAPKVKDWPSDPKPKDRAAGQINSGRARGRPADRRDPARCGDTLDRAPADAPDDAGLRRSTDRRRGRAIGELRALGLGQPGLGRLGRRRGQGPQRSPAGALSRRGSRWRAPTPCRGHQG